MRLLAAQEFAGLLDRADVSQARFARLSGVTARQVNNWCRGRAPVPTWAALLAIVLHDRSAESLELQLEEALQAPLGGL